MIFTKDSTVSEALGVKPHAKTILEKYIGRPIQDWEIASAARMSLQTVAAYVGMPTATLEAMIKQLNEG